MEEHKAINSLKLHIQHSSFDHGMVCPSNLAISSGSPVKKTYRHKKPFTLWWCGGFMVNFQNLLFGILLSNYH
jgi:hypothetical protein